MESTIATVHQADSIGFPESSERNLVRRLKAGDEEAFEEMVRTLGGRLLSVARRFLSNEDEARDALQDALLSAFKGLRHFDEQSQLSTWLHRIVVNAALMRIRSRSRRPEQSIEVLLPRFAEDGHHVESYVSPTERVDRVMEREEMRKMVRAAIAQLPEQYRAVLLMRDIEEMSTREAADALGISENATKLRLHRARQALATLIRKTRDGAGEVDRRGSAARIATARAPRSTRGSMWSNRFAASASPRVALAAL